MVLLQRCPCAGLNEKSRLCNRVTDQASSSPPPQAAPDSFLHRVWKRLTSGRFLFVSITVHLLFALIAVILVVQVVRPKRKLTFSAAPPADVNKPREHQIKMAQKQKTMSAPAPMKRITTTALSKVAMPEMPAMTSNMPSTITGMASSGLGLGTVGSMGGSSGTGGGIPFFGLQNSGAGLEGHFYDLKRDAANHPSGMNLSQYAAFLKQFTSGAWMIPHRYKYHASKAVLYSKFFFFPAIKDTEAGKAFQSPDSGPGMWIAHYKGSFSAPEEGSFRLVGWGDNVMIVKIAGALVLDASDHGYTGRHREEAGGVTFAGKSSSTPIFFGPWITFHKGDIKPIEVVVGDEGGIFCAGLFLQKQGQPYKQNKNGIPELPLVFIGTPSSNEKSALAKYLPPESLTGPYFRSEKGTESLLP